MLFWWWVGSFGWDAVEVVAEGLLAQDCGLLLALLMLLVSAGTFTRQLATANGMASTTNLRIVNTSMLRGNATGNIIAGLSKRFSLDMKRGTALMVSFVNCGAVRMGTAAGVGVALRRSGRLLSRIMIVNCKDIGHGSMAATMSAISAGSLSRHPVMSTTRTLRNGTTNISIVRPDNRPNKNVDVHMHNAASFGNDGSPLCMISNIPISGVGFLSPGSVRDLSVLGSTSSTTVCNSHTTGNIMLVAAGTKTRNGTGITLGMRCNVAGMTGDVSTLGARRCHRLRRRVKTIGPTTLRNLASRAS